MVGMGYTRSRSNSERRKRYSPVGVRLGLTSPALIQRRRVGMLIPRCWEAAEVLIQGSSEPGVVLGLSMVFMVVQERTCAVENRRKPPRDALRSALDAPTT